MTGEDQSPRGVAESDFPVEALGKWPNINLIVIEEQDFGAKSGVSWVVRIHLDIPLKSKANYDGFRNIIKAGDNHAAREFLRTKGLLAQSTFEAEAMLRAALP